MFSTVGLNKIGTRCVLFIAVAFRPFMVLPVYAQVAGATLSGTVTDSSGAVVPAAQVSVKNLATDVTRDVITDAVGFYTAPNLLPGSYEVKVSAPGFTTEVRSGISLTVGAQQLLNLTLRVGNVTEQVQVAGEAPAVELASSSISATVQSTTVRELPLNGRSWTDLATLQNGVNTIETQPAAGGMGADRGNRGYGTQLTISGQKPVQNTYRLDGINIQDYSNGGPGSVLGASLGVDAIQEFSLLTSNYSAEYGRTSGGVVNAITRSGTNQFHGDAYEFLRNSTLDARNFFDAGTIPPFKRNQFGGSAGGPIRKDKTFVFGDYEGIRQSKGVTQVSTVPSAAARAGSLCSVPGTPPVCTPSTVTVDPSAAKYLAFYPLPNGPLRAGGDTGILSFAGQQVLTENFFTSRVDHKISDKDSMFGTYVYDDTPYSYPDPLDTVLYGSHTNRQIIVLEENHIFGPGVLNSVRAGFNRTGAANNRGVQALNPLAADLSLGAVPGRTAARMTVGGVSMLQGGIGGATSAFHFWNSWQVYDDAFVTRGTHFLKFGGNLERMQYNIENFAFFNGVFSFGSLQNFLTNIPSRFNAFDPHKVAPFGQRQTLFGAYIQDDWRWRPNVTLNLGLRYETVNIPTEVQNKLTHINSLTDSTLHLGSPLMPNPTRANFEPRVGLSWDPFKNGRTAVRAGLGVFDVLPLPYLFALLESGASPFYFVGNVKGPQLAGTFFSGSNALLGPSSETATYVDQNPHRNYVFQWNVNVQHELAPSLTAMVGYVGSRGVHQQFRDDDADIVMPVRTPQGLFWPTPQASGTTLNPNFGDIKAMFFGARSYYDALEVGIQKRLSHGVQLQGSFTWGKSMDNSSATIVPDAFSNSIGSLQWIDPALTRGLSDFDIGRTLVINGIWQVPAWRSATGTAGWIANGWQLGGVFKLNDGVPFTPTLGTDGDPLGLNSSDPWTFPNRLVGPGCQSLVNPGNPNTYIKTQCFAVPSVTPAIQSLCDTTVGQPGQCLNLRGNSGRNVVIGPGLANLDFSVFKNNYVRRVSENFNVQFRAEFFNILNRASFATPITPDNTDIFDSSGSPTGVAGLLTSTTTTSREIQFALKLIW